MKRRYLIFLLAFPLFTAVAGLLLPARSVFAANSYIVEDTGVRGDFPTTNYNASSSVILYTGGRALVKFNHPGYVSDGQFYFYIHSGSSGQTAVLKKIPNSWVASTVTWNTQPAVGDTIASYSLNASVPGWHNIDVTDYINETAGAEYISLNLALSSGGSANLYLTNNANAPYLQYTPAPLTKPAAPAHCWNFDDNQDIFGNLDLTLNNGATVGTAAGVVDYGLGLPSAFFSDATFLSPYTAAGDFSVSFWASGSTSTQVEVGSTASDGWKISYIPNNYVQIYSDSASTNLGTVGDSDFIAVVFSGGVVTLTVNTTTYTDTLALPTPSNDTYQIYGDSGAVVDQLVIFTTALSGEEIAWLYRGGVGRSCGEWVPTALTTIPYPTPQYYVELENGGRVDVFLQVTAGELIIGLFGLLTFITVIVLAIRQLAHRSASNES